MVMQQQELLQVFTHQKTRYPFQPWNCRPMRSNRCVSTVNHIRTLISALYSADTEKLSDDNQIFMVIFSRPNPGLIPIWLIDEILTSCSYCPDIIFLIRSNLLTNYPHIHHFYIPSTSYNTYLIPCNIT